MSILSQFKQSQNTDFPNVRPSLDLRFALAKKLDPRITFTRGSTGTYFGSDGLMRTAGVNEPRFDHDPITGQSLGLLIEESRSNLFTYSDIEGTVGSTPTGFQPAAGASSGQSVVVSTDISLGPNGQSAKHTRGTSSDNNMGYIFSSGLTVGQTYCASIWLYIPPSQAQKFAGKTITIPAETSPAVTYISLGSFNTNLVGVWQRAYSVFTANSTGVGIIPRTTAVAGSFFYTDCWQLEHGAFPTSYIPTTASTVTRSADNASMTGTNFSSWYNQSEGTLYSNISIIRNLTTDSTGSWSLDNSSYANGYTLFHTNTTSSRLSVRGPNTSSSGRSIGDVTNVDITKFKNCCIILPSVTNRILSCSNGNFSGIEKSFSSGVSLNRLNIGFNNIIGTPANNYLNGTISRLTYYPIQLTNQQLINLTS